MDKLCRQAAERFIRELKKEENMDQIENDILNPVIRYIGNRLYPYVVAVSVMLCITLLLLSYILICIRGQRG